MVNLNQNIVILGNKRAVEEKLWQFTGIGSLFVNIYMIDSIVELHRCIIENNIDIFIIYDIDDVNCNQKKGECDKICEKNVIKKIRGYKDHIFTPIIVISENEKYKSNMYEEYNTFTIISPSDDEALKKAVRQTVKCSKFRRVRQVNRLREVENRISYKVDGIIRFIDIEKIVYIESRERVLFVYLSDGENIEIPYYSFKRFTEKDKSSRLIQCNRNIMVNKSYVESIDVINRYIQLTGKRGSISIGSAYKKELLQAFE